MPVVQRPSLALLVAAAGSIAGAQTVPTCSGGELYSTESVRYGRWEIRMLAAAKPGTVSSFFTYYNDSWKTSDGEPWREIDLEVLGNRPEGFQSNIITLDAPETVKSKSETFHSTADVSTDYHTYTIDWTPDSVVWRMDGELVRRTSTGNQIKLLQSKDESYRMNLWASNSVDWVGELDLASLPVYQVVNWMAYSAYTPGHGPDGSNFTEEWVDDFKSFDAGRWARGDWGFEDNLAMFTPKNIQVVDGYLVLALTRKGEEGIKGSFRRDPLGNARPTASVRSAERMSNSDVSIRSVSHGLRIERGSTGMAEPITVSDASGRVVARSAFAVGQKSADLPVSRDGVLIVRVADRTARILP